MFSEHNASSLVNSNFHLKDRGKILAASKFCPCLFLFPLGKKSNLEAVPLRGINKFDFLQKLIFAGSATAEGRHLVLEGSGGLRQADTFLRKVQALFLLQNGGKVDAGGWPVRLAVLVS